MEIKRVMKLESSSAYSNGYSLVYSDGFTCLSCGHEISEMVNWNFIERNLLDFQKEKVTSALCMLNEKFDISLKPSLVSYLKEDDSIFKLSKLPKTIKKGVGIVEYHFGHRPERIEYFKLILSEEEYNELTKLDKELMDTKQTILFDLTFEYKNIPA